MSLVGNLDSVLWELDFQLKIRERESDSLPDPSVK